jgi:hypothetical protein
MARLERQVQKLAERIASISDYEEAGRLQKDLVALRVQLHDTEERWLELST